MPLRITMQKKILTLFFFLSILTNMQAQITWEDSGVDYLFKLKSGVSVSDRYSLSDTESNGILGINLSSSILYESTGSPLIWSNTNNTGQYSIVKDPNIISSTYSSFTADNPDGYIFVFTGGRYWNDPQAIITMQNLQGYYKLEFDLIDVAELGTGTATVEIRPLGFPNNNVDFTVTSATSQNVSFNTTNRTNSYTFTFHKEGPSTFSGAIYLKNFSNLYSSNSALGIKDVRLVEIVRGYLQSSNKLPLPGEITTLSLDKPYTGTETEFIWRSRPAGSSEAFTEFDRTTTAEVQTTINVDTEYQLQVGSETVTLVVNVGTITDLIYITSMHSKTICRGSSNILVAGGMLINDGIMNSSQNQLNWEKFNTQINNWEQVSTSSDSITYRTEELTQNTRYRVTMVNGYFNGVTYQDITSEEFELIVNPNCSENCDGLESQLIFHETFGFFLAENIYVDSKGTVRTGAKIGNFWAPDPYNYVVPKVQGGHTYAWDDPKNLPGGDYNWCPNGLIAPYNHYFRIEDGYYALLTSPYDGSCGNAGDFWKGTDRTGNSNGAMLFVNSGSGEGTPIYKQKVELACPQSVFNLTVDVGNAVIGTDKVPVNVRVRLLDIDGTTELALIENDGSGVPGSGSVNQSSWQVLSLDINLGNEPKREFYVEISNLNAPGSDGVTNGNDILLDEIKFSVCLPKVTLILDGMEPENVPESVMVCDSFPILLEAYVGDVSEGLITTPRYLFQYKDEQGDWQNISTRAEDMLSKTMTIYADDPRFREETIEFRVIFAEEQVMNKIINGDPLDPCDRYAYSESRLVIENIYGGPMLPDETILVCEGDIVGGEDGLTGTREWEIPGWTHQWRWAWSTYSVDGHAVPEPSNNPDDKVIKFQITDVTTLPDTLYFYAFDGPTNQDCYIFQKIILKEKSTVKDDIIESYYAGCDSVLITADVPDNVALIWKMNGNPVDPSVVFIDPSDERNIKIKPDPSLLPLSGKISAEVDTSRVDYCSIEPDIADFRVLAGETFQLEMEGTPESLCLDPAAYDTIILRAIISPAGAAEDVLNYYWTLDGNLIAVTSTAQDSLILSTDPANPYNSYLVSGAKMNFGVSIVDGVCFTSADPSVEAQLYMEINESYNVRLASNDTTVCLSAYQDDDVMFTLEALLSALDGTSTGDVQANIKKYIWRINGHVFATTGAGESTYGVEKSDPSIATWFTFAAGTSAEFSVTAVDSICFEDQDGPTGSLTVFFNENFGIDIVPANGNNVVCIPEVNDDEILARFEAVTIPNQESAKHIERYIWELGADRIRIETTDNILELTRGAVLALNEVVHGLQTYIPLRVTVEDNICQNGDITEEIILDVRFGGFVLALAVDAEACLDDTDEIILTARINPQEAMNGIDKYVWLDGDVELGETLKEDLPLPLPDPEFQYVVEKSNPVHEYIFTTGYTARFTVLAEDAICGTVKAINPREVRISETYSIELDFVGDDTELCLSDVTEAEKQKPLITLQATVTPQTAVNHILEYVWTVRDEDGNLVIESSTFRDPLDTELKYLQFDLFYDDVRNQIGKTLYFSVNTWDNICVTKDSDEGRASGSRTIKINSVYNLDLNVNSITDRICLGDLDSPPYADDQVLITLIATSNPVGADNHINQYVWEVSVDGAAAVEIGRTGAGENTFELTYADLRNYIGSNLLFSVNSEDGVCVELDDANGRGKATNEISINSFYDLNLNVTSIADSICLGDLDNPPYADDQVLITLTATSDPAGADNHINLYVWEVSVDGAPVVEIGRTGSGENTFGLTYGMLKQYIGSNLLFSVNSEDGFCVLIGDENGRGTANREISILSFYNLDLQVNAINEKLCLGDLNNPYYAGDDVLIELVATSDPSDAAGHIQGYIWEVSVDGGAVTEIGRTGAGENTFALTYDDLKNYIGSSLLFGVNSWDGECVNVNDQWGRGTADIEIEVNSLYNLQLSVTGATDRLCLEDIDNPSYQDSDVLITLTATSDPLDAAGHIQGYIWQVTVDGTTSVLSTTGAGVNTYGITYGVLKNYIGRSLLFTVNSWDDICVDVESSWGRGTADRAIDINSRYQLDLTIDNTTGDLCIGDVDDPVYQDTEVLTTLTATSNPLAAAGHIQGYIWEVSEDDGPFTEIARTGGNGNTFGLTFGILKNYAGKNLKFRVNSWDDICVDVDDAYGRGDGVEITIAQKFNVEIVLDKNTLCSEGDKLILRAVVTPETARPLVKKYDWYSFNIETGERELLGTTLIPEFEIVTLIPGEYNLYVSVEDNICHPVDDPSISEFSGTIIVSDVLVVSLSPSADPVCQGNAVSLIASSSGVPTLYEWYKNGSLEYSNPVGNGETQNVIALSAEEAQGFSVKVYDAVCNKDIPVSSGEIDLDIFEPIDFSLSSDQTEVCLRDIIYINLKLEKGRPSVYQWYGTDEEGEEVLVATFHKEDDSYLGDVRMEDIPSGYGYWSYRVVASDGVCSDVSETYEGTIEVREPISIELLGDYQDVMIGSDLNLWVNVLTGEPVKYTWGVDGQILDVTYEPERSYTVTPKATSSYFVVASDLICPDNSSRWEIKVKLPTILTPYDGNGLNDYFMKSYEVEIFNRYGQKVFSGNDGWDGTYRGVLADPGVYFYVVVMKNGKVEKGTIELVKMK
jgi:hypothetical protein